MNQFLERLLLSMSMALFLLACKNAEKQGSENSQSTKTIAKSREVVRSQVATAERSDAGETFKACRAAFNARNESALAACYDDASRLIFVDYVPPLSAQGAAAILAVAKENWAGSSDLYQQSQLVLRKDNHFAAIVLRRGTSDDERAEQAPGVHGVSIFQGEMVTMTPSGTMRSRELWLDQGVLADQLGGQVDEQVPELESAWPEQIWQVAEGSLREAANLNTVEAMAGAIKKGDLAGYMEHVADNVTLHYIGEREERSGKAAYRAALSAWTSSANRTIKRDEIWAAGDWVVAINDHLTTLGGKGKPTKSRTLEFFQLANDKLKIHWVFANSMVYSAPLGARDADADADPDVDVDVERARDQLPTKANRE